MNETKHCPACGHKHHFGNSLVQTISRTCTLHKCPKCNQPFTHQKIAKAEGASR
jgi:predicted nucleic-acid-binding Zn-ribbon protein